MSFSAEIINTAGQPLTARVGTVIDTSPFQVDVQGTIFQGDRLGIIGSTPAVGSVVLLLGQSVKGAKSSGSSWVVMGEINPAP